MAATVELNAEVSGAGPDLIIMHGLFGSMRNWSSHAKQLASQAKVHLLDLRNHGASPWSEVMDYPAMAADLAAYMDRAGLARAHIIGHSMGGKTAMQFALDYPDRVDRLLVADIAPVAYDRTYDDYISAMRTSPLAAGNRQDVDAHLAKIMADRGVRAFILQNLTRADGGLRWRVNVDAIAANMAQIMAAPDLDGRAACQAPTLFLRGDRSDYVKNSDRPLLKTWFPNARVASLKDAGHWLHAEQPGPFIKSVRLFFGLSAGLT